MACSCTNEIAQKINSGELVVLTREEYARLIEMNKQATELLKVTGTELRDIQEMLK